MNDNNALVLAVGILNPNPKDPPLDNLIGEVLYMKRFDVELVDITVFGQGHIRLTPDAARELVKELSAIGIKGDE